MNAPISTADRIRELNDAFRTTGPSAGDWMLTCGVRAYGPDFIHLAIEAVQAHDSFNVDNAEQRIKKGKGAVKWTRLSCRSMHANAVRLQLHALAYNLASFLRTLALPKQVEHW